MTTDRQNAPVSLSSTSTNVVDLTKFRQKKMVDEDLARGRSPLYVSHLQGKAGSPKDLAGSVSKDADFGERLQRIKASLAKINNLMADLKKMSAQPSGKNS